MHGFPAVEPGNRVWLDVECGGIQQGHKRQLLDFTPGMLRDAMRCLIRDHRERGVPWWSEGFDTADLQEAKTLLEELSQ